MKSSVLVLRGVVTLLATLAIYLAQESVFTTARGEDISDAMWSSIWAAPPVSLASSTAVPFTGANREGGIRTNTCPNCEGGQVYSTDRTTPPARFAAALEQNAHIGPSSISSPGCPAQHGNCGCTNTDYMISYSNSSVGFTPPLLTVRQIFPSSSIADHNNVNVPNNKKIVVATQDPEVDNVWC